MRRETGYIKYITEKEFIKIFKWIKTIISPSMKMLLLVLLLLGIRTSEAINLKLDNFNKDFSQVRFELKKRKVSTIKERAIPPILSLMLKDYCKRWRCRMKDRYIFFSSYGSNSPNPHLQASSVRSKFKEMRKALDIKDIYHITTDGKPLYRLSPHTLRHFIVWRIYKVTGNDLISARDIIGHKKVETTAKYCRSLEAIHNERKIINEACQIAEI